MQKKSSPDRLSVLDVQRMLREHADSGIDVTKSPLDAVIGGKAYGFRVNSHLDVYSASDSQLHHRLHTNMMLGERPFITSIDSAPGSRTEWIGYHSRSNITNPWTLSIYPKVPAFFVNADRQDHFAHPHQHGSGPEDYYADMDELQPKIPLSHIQHKFDKDFETVHEVLKNNASAPLHHYGILRNHPAGEQVGVLRDGFDKNFNTKAALHHLANPHAFRITKNDIIKPMSGLISVSHDPDLDYYVQNYVYDPSTEQLHFIGER